MGYIQNEDIKSSSELVSGGGTAAQLPNDTKIYMTANSINDTLYNAVTNGQIGGGGSSNTGLITGNNSIPTGSIGSWVAYADAAGVSPVDMTGGSPNSTLTRNTSNPISSTADFLFTKNAGASRQGEGFSLTITSIPNKYKSRVCSFRFKYLTSSNYVDQAVGVFIYDITGTTVYQMNPLYIKKSSPIESSFADIQLPATLTSGFRIGFHVIGTDTTAYTINFSEFTFDEKDKVLAKYTRSTAQTLSNGVQTIIDFATKIYDSHSAVTTGASWKFTAPRTGYYKVNVSVCMANESYTQGNSFSYLINKNGSGTEEIYGVFLIPYTGTANWKIPFDGTPIFMYTGDYIQYQLSQSSGGSRSLYAYSQLNHIQIESI